MDSSIEKHCQVLGVSKSASLQEVKEAYRDLASVWHPDRFSGNSRLEKKATTKLTEINIAYEAVLSFLESRDRRAATEVRPPVDARPKEGPKDEPTGDVESGPAPGTRSFLGAGIALALIIILSLSALIYFVYRPGRQNIPTSSKISMPSSPRGTGEPGKEEAEKLPVLGKPTGGSAKTMAKKGDHAAWTGYFTLGSSKDEVMAIEGAPVQISDARWNYGSSYVDFDKGRVVGWYNSSLDPLRIRMTAPREPGKDYFTVGSSKDEVLAIQGTPVRVSGNKWSFGFSYVEFKKAGVAGWYNSSMDPLHVKMVPSKEPEKPYITLGSSKEEVLAIQGTPTKLSDGRWEYGYSYVDFEKGRVTRWYNSEQDPLRIDVEP